MVLDSLRPAPALRFEGNARAGAGERPDRVRDDHFARGRQAADPRGDVDGAAVNVPLFADDVAGVEAEMEREARLAASSRAGKGGLNRSSGAGEDGEDTVTQKLAFYRTAVVLTDYASESTVEVAGLRAEGGIAEALGEGCGVLEIG